jgi:hypothetical protein
MIIAPALETPTVVPGFRRYRSDGSDDRAAVVILASVKMLGHSPKARLLVTMIEVRS